MAVTWKALAYSSEVTSAVTSEGVVRSTADSSLTVAIAGFASSASVSTADSKAVSAGVLASQANSGVASAVVVQSTADSSIVLVVSANLSTTTSQNTAQSTLISSGTVATSTADSKAVSAGTAASTADSKAVSAGTAASTADSKAVSAASIALSYTNSEGVIRSTADSSLTVKAINTFGGATGNLAMNGFQITDNVIQTVATSAAITGVTAVVGKIVFATDSLSPWICTASV